MFYTPREIYEKFRHKIINKKETIKLLLSQLENIEDDELRKDAVEILYEFDLKHTKVFKILENILISDENENLRYAAAKIIKSKFLNKALDPFLWSLQHESYYNCLMIILESFKEIKDERLDTILLKEIKKVEFKGFWNVPLFQKDYDEIPHKTLVDILINFKTLKFLKKKFDKLEYKFEGGYVTELDFSKVEKNTIYWRDKCELQDNTELLGLSYLNHLKKVKFFPTSWVFQNELTFMNSIALIQGIEGLINSNAKSIIISQLNNLDNENVNFVHKFNLKSKSKLENLSLSKLSDILRNFLIMLFIKSRYSSLEYEIKDNELYNLKIEDISLITIPEYYTYFKSLQSLVLKRCKIYSIPECLASLTNLEILDLEGNNLKIIPKSISQLKFLKILNLSDNQIETLPSMLGNLNSLQDLNLKSNKLKKLPRSIGYLYSLKSLNLGRNNLSLLPSSIGSLKSLKFLNLNSNNLKSLPKALGLLSSLESLKLSNNNLRELPNTINSLSKLKNLEVEDNNLSYLPQSIEQLKFLKILKVGWNKLEKLPSSIGSLTSLKYLNLTSNHLVSLHKSICNLSNLEYLEISFNKIEFLPGSIGNLKSLKTLKVSDNNLRLLPNSLCTLILLETLNLSGNAIEYLPESINTLKSLKKLWLNGNNLYYLPDSMGKLFLLEKLNLDNNRIFSLPRSIKNLQNLKDLSFNLNNIDSIFEYPILSSKFVLKDKVNSDYLGNSEEIFDSINNDDIPNIVFDYPIINRNLTFER
ncbi:MAG: hypothetical protein ACFFA3_00820 [Promethearchaeota archaeon]